MNISTVGIAQENDNLDKIYEYIFEIIKYEIKDKEFLFISFDKIFWESYILIFNDLKSLKKINKMIHICSLLEKNLSSDKLGLTEKIRKLKIELIKKGEL